MFQVAFFRVTKRDLKIGQKLDTNCITNTDTELGCSLIFLKHSFFETPSEGKMLKSMSSLYQFCITFEKNEFINATVLALSKWVLAQERISREIL